MGLLIQIDHKEWRRLNENLLERAGESLKETERAAVMAFFDLAEPHVEEAQIEMLHSRRDDELNQYDETTFDVALFENETGAIIRNNRVETKTTMGVRIWGKIEPFYL